MKLLFCMLLLVMTAGKVKAQDDYIGATRAAVKAAMKFGKLKLLNSDVTDDGEFKFDQYQVEEERTISFYFDKANVCTMLVDSRPMRMLISSIKELNIKYKKIGDDTWINANYTMSVKLTASDIGFIEKYQKI